MEKYSFETMPLNVVQVYSSVANAEKAGYKVIYAINKYFDGNCHPSELDAEDLRILRELNGSEVLDFNTGTITTKFDEIASYKDVSSGVKTVLFVRFVGKQRLKGKCLNWMVDVNQCGENVMGYALLYASVYQVPVYYNSMQFNTREELMSLMSMCRFQLDGGEDLLTDLDLAVKTGNGW